MFQKPAPTTKPCPVKSSPVTKPSVSAAKVPVPTAKPSGLPLQSNVPISIPTVAATQVSVPVVKTSTETKEERWDEDTFQGLWDSNEDKGLKLEYPSTLDSALPSTTISASPLPNVAPIAKPSIIQQTVDYGHGHGHGHSHGQGECC